ncbi:MAG: fibronectin type III domain-containing protein [Proteobacteria bacterium]|nr:fibronectin type III domain-containing protein [Pseudomonadota bacterium]
MIAAHDAHAASTPARIRRSLGLLLGLSALAIFGLPAAAQAGELTVRWQHPTPAEVAGFRLHWGTRSGDYPGVRNVQLPAPVDGVYSYRLTDLPEDRPVFVVVSAYDASANRSEFSNERSFTAEPTAPEPLGQPGRPVLVEP